MHNKAILFCFFACVYLVSAHSWLQCADYTEENGRMWSATNCRGWPRAYSSAFQYAGYAFGADAGYNYQPTDAAPCRTQPTSTDYTATYPKATYAPGQRVCLAWPPKNHVAANCDNANIPDHGTRIYSSGVNPTSDPTLTVFHTNLIYDFGANTGTAGTGFMNCPDFCANNGAALCTGCFQIPTDLAVGDYTFLWEWAFNADTDLYTSCYDVSIVASTTNAITETYTKVSPDQYKALLASGSPDTPVAGTGTATGTATGGSSTGSTPANSGSSVPPIKCTQDEDCGSAGICKISGVCADVAGSTSSGIGPGGAAAVVFALLFVAAVAALVAGYFLIYKKGKANAQYDYQRAAS